MTEETIATETKTAAALIADQLRIMAKAIESTGSAVSCLVVVRTTRDGKPVESLGINVDGRNNSNYKYPQTDVMIFSDYDYQPNDMAMQSAIAAVDAALATG